MVPPKNPNRRKGYEAAHAQLVAYNDQKKILRAERREVFEKKCKGCKEQIPYEKRRNDFCSHACSQRVQNRARGLKPFPTEQRCLGCRADLPPGLNKFCDPCIEAGAHHAWKRKTWENLKSPTQQRAYLIRELGRVCQLCGLAKEWNGKPLPVVMDHIDGNSENNARSNIRLVCPNCDAQLPTYSGRNKGRGRLKRRLYRQNLKSRLAVVS